MRLSGHRLDPEHDRQQQPSQRLVDGVPVACAIALEPGCTSGYDRDAPHLERHLWQVGGLPDGGDGHELVM